MADNFVSKSSLTSNITASESESRSFSNSETIPIFKQQMNFTNNKFQSNLSNINQLPYHSNSITGLSQSLNQYPLSVHNPTNSAGGDERDSPYIQSQEFLYSTSKSPSISSTFGKESGRTKNRSDGKVLLKEIKEVVNRIRWDMSEVCDFTMNEVSIYIYLHDDTFENVIMTDEVLDSFSDSEELELNPEIRKQTLFDEDNIHKNNHTSTSKSVEKNFSVLKENYPISNDILEEGAPISQSLHSTASSTDTNIMDLSLTSNNLNTTSKRKGPCHYFFRSAFCAKGALCKYSHIVTLDSYNGELIYTNPKNNLLVKAFPGGLAGRDYNLSLEDKITNEDFVNTDSKAKIGPLQFEMDQNDETVEVLKLPSTFIDQRGRERSESIESNCSQISMSSMGSFGSERVLGNNSHTRTPSMYSKENDRETVERTVLDNLHLSVPVVKVLRGVDIDLAFSSHSVVPVHRTFAIAINGKIVWEKHNQSTWEEVLQKFEKTSRIFPPYFQQKENHEGNFDLDETPNRYFQPFEITEINGPKPLTSSSVKYSNIERNISENFTKKFNYSQYFDSTDGRGSSSLDRISDTRSIDAFKEGGKNIPLDALKLMIRRGDPLHDDVRGKGLPSYGKDSLKLKPLGNELFDSLPTEILHILVSFLSPKDVSISICTCTLLRNLFTEMDFLWYYYCCEEFWKPKCQNRFKKKSILAPWIPFFQKVIVKVPEESNLLSNNSSGNVSADVDDFKGDKKREHWKTEESTKYLFHQFQKDDLMPADEHLRTALKLKEDLNAKVFQENLKHTTDMMRKPVKPPDLYYRKENEIIYDRINTRFSGNDNIHYYYKLFTGISTVKKGIETTTDYFGSDKTRNNSSNIVHSNFSTPIGNSSTIRNRNRSGESWSGEKGDYEASASGVHNPPYTDRNVIIFEDRDNKVKQGNNTTTTIIAVSTDEERNRLITCSNMGLISIYDLQNGHRFKSSCDLRCKVECMKCTDTRIFVGNSRGVLFCIDIDDMSSFSKHKITQNQSSITDVCILNGCGLTRAKIGKGLLANRLSPFNLVSPLTKQREKTFEEIDPIIVEPKLRRHSEGNPFDGKNCITPSKPLNLSLLEDASVYSKQESWTLLCGVKGGSFVMVEGENLTPTQSFTLPPLAADWLAWTTLQKLPRNILRDTFDERYTDKGSISTSKEDKTLSGYNYNNIWEDDISMTKAEVSKDQNDKNVGSLEKSNLEGNEEQETSTSQEQLDLDFALAMSLQNDLYISEDDEDDTVIEKDFMHESKNVLAKKSKKKSKKDKERQKLENQSEKSYVNSVQLDRKGDSLNDELQVSHVQVREHEGTGFVACIWPDQLIVCNNGKLSDIQFLIGDDDATSRGVVHLFKENCCKCLVHVMENTSNCIADDNNSRQKTILCVTACTHDNTLRWWDLRTEKYLKSTDYFDLLLNDNIHLPKIYREKYNKMNFEEVRDEDSVSFLPEHGGPLEDNNNPTSFAPIGEGIPEGERNPDYDRIPNSCCGVVGLTSVGDSLISSFANGDIVVWYIPNQTPILRVSTSFTDSDQSNSRREALKLLEPVSDRGSLVSCLDKIVLHYKDGSSLKCRLGGSTDKKAYHEEGLHMLQNFDSCFSTPSTEHKKKGKTSRSANRPKEKKKARDHTHGVKSRRSSML